MLDQIKDLQRDLEDTQMIAKDASEEMIRIRQQASEVEQQAEAAVKAQSLLHDVESNFLHLIEVL